MVPNKHCGLQSQFCKKSNKSSNSITKQSQKYLKLLNGYITRLLPYQSAFLFIDESGSNQVTDQAVTVSCYVDDAVRSRGLNIRPTVNRQIRFIFKLVNIDSFLKGWCKMRCKIVMLFLILFVCVTYVFGYGRRSIVGVHPDDQKGYIILLRQVTRTVNQQSGQLFKHQQSLQIFSHKYEKLERRVKLLEKLIIVPIIDPCTIDVVDPCSIESN